MAGSDLVVSVGANIRQLERQMKAAADVAEKAADDIEKKFRAANPSLGGDFGLGVLKGAIAGIAFDKITRGIIDANKEIAGFGESARRAGIEVQRFQELRLAAQGKGIEGKTFDSGVNDLAKSLNEARTKENDLTALLDANNIKYKDRKGEVISTNEALTIAADLISRAATEQDKLDIANKLGIPADFVPLLEGGSAALEKLARNAAEAGTILDADVIAKAKQFDDAWNSAWASFASNAKASIFSIAQGLSSLVSQAQAVNAANSAAVASQQAERRDRRNEAFKMGLANAGGRAVLDAEESAASRARVSGFRQSEIARRNQEVVTETPPSRPGRGNLGSDATRVPTSGKSGGGGGGGGKSEDDQAQARLERYIETLMRQNAVLDAEVATFGKSNTEKQKAVELAKAQVDLSKVDETERQKIIASLTREIDLSEQKRKKLGELKLAQDGLRDAQKFFGDAATDALEDLIINGAKAEDVVKNLTKALAKAALQAALTGSGPLAGIFGTAGTNGATGGLFGELFKGLGGALFGKATGGGVNAGQAYRVGERGPETFVPTVPGQIVPNPGASPTGQRMSITVQVVGARGNAEITEMVQRGVTSGLAQYDRAVLPSSLERMQKRAG